MIFSCTKRGNSSCKYYSNEHHQNLKVMYSQSQPAQNRVWYLIKSHLDVVLPIDDPLGFVLPLLPSSAAYLQGEKAHNITQGKNILGT